MRAMSLVAIRMILAIAVIAVFALAYGIALLWETLEDGPPEVATRRSEGRDVEPDFPAPLLGD